MKIILLAFVALSISYAKIAENNKVRYRTSFGSCPTKVVGSLTLKLVKIFEEQGSLLELKKFIIKNGAKDKYYLSSYDIQYDPMTKFLKFSYQCPEPLVKVQIYKENENKSYSAVLVSNGKLFDAVYEVLLRADNKLEAELPSLVIPIEDIEKDILKDISALVGDLPFNFRKDISEVILDDKHNITLILSINNKPISVFLGRNNWTDKLSKLQKIIAYMEKKKKIPVVINITNPKKVVVKFSDTL